MFANRPPEGRSLCDALELDAVGVGQSQRFEFVGARNAVHDCPRVVDVVASDGVQKLVLDDV